MNRHSRSPAGDRRRDACSLLGATLLAALAWIFFLSHWQRLFSGSEPAAPPVESLDMQIADLPSPELRPDTRERGPNANTGKAKSRPAQLPAAREALAPPRPHHVPRASQPIEEQPPLAMCHPPETARQPEPVPASPTSPVSLNAAVAHASSSVTSPASASQSAAVQSATPANGSARIVSQPIPVLPDDLREDGYRLLAIARFVIHADGTFDVVLVKPTPNPRLNQILMATLHEWRFVPATDAGHPVESHQDVRVHFNVD